MVSLLFIALAAVCKAVIDTLMHHFETSIFYGLNEKWWNPYIAHNYSKRIPFTNYPVDAFHLFNSAMIIFFILSVPFYENYLWWGWEVLIAGTWFNIVFNTFYNKILR